MINVNEGAAVAFTEESNIVPLIFKKSQLTNIDENYFKVELSIAELEKLIKINQSMLDWRKLSREERDKIIKESCIKKV